VNGVLAGELEDVLAEVGLDRSHARRLERIVQTDLLGRHRLRLGGDLRAVAPADLGHIRRRVVARAGEVDVAASRLDRGAELLVVLFELAAHAHAFDIRHLVEYPYLG